VWSSSAYSKSFRATLRGFAAQLSEFEKTTNFQPALIEIEDALVAQDSQHEPQQTVKL
jgi:hypothetical protein